MPVLELSEPLLLYMCYYNCAICVCAFLCVVVLFSQQILHSLRERTMSAAPLLFSEK
jgi:hypothetical protein